MTLKRPKGKRSPKPLPAIGLFNVATKRLQMVNGCPYIDIDPNGYSAGKTASEHPDMYAAEQVFIIVPGKYSA